jgi:chemotaxis protein CheD
MATLVGSCVAVTLWSRRSRVGGMNHYLLPRHHGQEGSPRYGDTAMEMLIACMQRHGCANGDLEAGIYGGATILAVPSGGPLGDQNVQMAWRILRARGVRVLDEQVGGRVARRVTLDVASGEVRIATIGGGQ